MSPRGASDRASTKAGLGRSAALLLAAALAGAAGLALETILLDTAGLGLGYGRSTALGLSTFLAAWALGAHRSGRRGRSARSSLLRAGLLAAALAWPAVWIVLWTGRIPGGPATAIVALVAIAAPAFALGGFLAPLARARAGNVALLFAANLAGSVLGAWYVADAVVAEHGRLAAAACAGVLAALAGAVGALASGSASTANDDANDFVASARSEIGWRRAAVVVAAATAWVASLEWIGLRLGVLWLGGMQPALRAVLAASLIALAAGAAILPWLVPRGPGGVVALVATSCAASLWPFAAGAALERAATSSQLLAALLIVGPALAPFGALLPVLHRTMPLESGERLGRLLLAEAWGAFLGLPLVQLLLVPRIGLAGSLAALEVFGAAAALALLRVRPRAAVAAAGCASACALLAFSLEPPALASPPLSNPALSVRSFAEDRDFAVAVVDDGLQGERTLLTDGFRAAGTGRDYRYMRALGHLPLLLSPTPRRVAVLALGTGTTLGAVALHPEAERIDVLEISRAVVDAAPSFREKNRGALDGDPRVRVRLGDGRATLARERGAYDVITMEPLLPDSPFGVYLYTREFYGRARDALAPGGLLCQWVPPHALEPASFQAVLAAFASAFPWSSVWVFGPQVVLVGGDAMPTLDAARFAAAGDLAADLADLGIDTPARVAARWVADGRAIPAAARPLSDEDPWIVYRPRRSGPVLLGDLPRNLAFLRARSSAPPAAWSAGASATDGDRILGVASVREAREAFASREAALRGWKDEAEPASLERSLERARALAPDDPELRELEGDIAFVADLRAAVGALASQGNLAQALGSLRRAANARPERGDVRLYLALALERAGDPTAPAELARALEVCPGIARTPAGERCRSLGLSDRAWTLARASAESARQDLFRKRPFRGASAAGTPSSP